MKFSFLNKETKIDSIVGSKLSLIIAELKEIEGGLPPKSSIACNIRTSIKALRYAHIGATKSD